MIIQRNDDYSIDMICPYTLPNDIENVSEFIKWCDSNGLTTNVFMQYYHHERGYERRVEVYKLDGHAIDPDLIMLLKLRWQS